MVSHAWSRIDRKKVVPPLSCHNIQHKAFTIFPIHLKILTTSSFITNSFTGSPFESLVKTNRDSFPPSKQKGKKEKKERKTENIHALPCNIKLNIFKEIKKNFINA